MAALLLAGCSLGTVRDLEVRSLGRVWVEEADAEALGLRMELEIYNPRDVKARIRDLDCKLALTGGFVATGRLEGETDLPAQGSRMIELPLSVTYGDVTEADFEALLRERIPYRISGKASVLEPVEKDNVRLEIKGTVAAPEIVEAHLTGRSAAPFLSKTVVRADLGSLLTGRAVVELELENPFSFAVPIEAFDYRVTLRGRTIGTGAAARDAVLRPGPNQLQLPIRGDPLRALAGAASGVLDGGGLDLAVTGSVIIRRGDRRLKLHLDYDLTE